MLGYCEGEDLQQPCGCHWGGGHLYVGLGQWPGVGHRLAETDQQEDPTIIKYLYQAKPKNLRTDLLQTSLTGKPSPTSISLRALDQALALMLIHIPGAAGRAPVRLDVGEEGGWAPDPAGLVVRLQVGRGRAGGQLEALALLGKEVALRPRAGQAERH